MPKGIPFGYRTRRNRHILVMSLDPRLVKDEWHAQKPLPKIDRRLPVCAHDRDMVNTLRLDLLHRFVFCHIFYPRFAAR